MQEVTLEQQLGLATTSIPPVQEEAEVVTAAYDQRQAHDLAKNSLDFLAALAAPAVFRYCFPPVFLSAWALLTDYAHRTRDFSKLALGLPRGFGKTTFIKVFILYCILFTSKRYIIVISATEKHAINVLSDVVSFLKSPNIKAIFGDYSIGIVTDTQAQKVFSFRGRTIILEGIGQGGAIRGTNRDNERPDLMIFEDCQTREDADSEVVSEAIEQWMYGTAMKAKSPFGCLYIFVANMYPTKHSILRKLKSNPSWTKFIVGGILSSGESLWEDLQPIAQLLEEYQNDVNSGHPEIFAAEVLNDEDANAGLSIDLSKIPAFPFSEGEVTLGDFIIIDPSNDKTNSDMVSIGHFRILGDKQTPVLMEVIDDRLSPGDIIRQALKLALKSGSSLIAVEANAFQYSLLYWFRVVTEQLGITGIECVPIYSGSLSKTTRILTMFKAYAKGEIQVHPEARLMVHHQMAEFNPKRRDNTDNILDLLTYCQRVQNEFSNYIAIQAPLASQDMGDAQVWNELDNVEY